jgi:sulfide:quinone oxidoreductase
MPDFKALDEKTSVCGFVPPDQLAALASQFRTIINSRPDGEEASQPPSAAFDQAARASGISYRSIPIVPGQISEDQIAEFAQALAESPGPVLAFCKSGMRAASLWALARARELGSGAVIAAAARAGYDLAPLIPRLDAQARGR